MAAGVDLIINLVRPTLGPTGRNVAVEHVLPGNPVELLDSAATIARRIERVSGWERDMGAMYVRHALWRLQQRTGDGTATAAVLFQVIFREARKAVAAGCNAQLLRQELEGFLPLLLDSLRAQVTPLSGLSAMEGFALAVGRDEEVARHLAQIFDVIGPLGRLEIRAGQGRDTRHNFVEGVYWEEGVLHENFLVEKTENRSVLYDPAIVVSDLEVKSAAETVHLLETAAAAGATQLLLVCKGIADPALAPLFDERNQKTVRVVAVRLPGSFIDMQARHMRDLCVVSGANLLSASAGDSLLALREAHFGQARRAWANRDTFGLVTGKGDPKTFREHTESLTQAYRAADDEGRKGDLEGRVTRLMGATSTLRIGALNEGHYQTRKTLVEQTSRALRAALMGGVVPGGGAALRDCRRVLPEGTNPLEERAQAIRILREALAAPLRTIMSNAGLPGGAVALAVESLPQGYCVNVLTGDSGDAQAMGILDSADVIAASLRTAVMGAAQLLTTDVLVHNRDPEIQYNT